MTSPGWRGASWRAAVLLGALGLAVHSALVTLPNANPDEAIHLDAFRWFEGHVAPPAPGSGEVLYSAYGWSRVYTGELVYPLFGRLGALWRVLRGAPAPDLLYRLLNVSLLPLVLVPLLWGASTRLDLPRAGLFMAGVPQVICLFSSASSDPFAVAAASLLTVVALRHAERPRPEAWPLLGALGALVLLAKPTAWFALPAALILVPLGWGRLRPRPVLPLLGAIALAAGLASACRVLPHLLEPGSRGVELERMRAEQAEPRFDPERPTAPGFHLRLRGVPFTDIALDPAWWARSSASSWAMLGYMTTRPPRVVLALAAALWLGLAGVALRGLLAAPANGDHLWRRRVALTLVTAPLLAVAASLLHSWAVDYQPQGRYLLPAVVPLALILGGLKPPRWPWLERWQLALLVAHALLGWAVALLLPGRVPLPPG